MICSKKTVKAKVGHGRGRHWWSWVRTRVLFDTCQNISVMGEKNCEKFAFLSLKEKNHFYLMANSVNKIREENQTEIVIVFFYCFI